MIIHVNILSKEKALANDKRNRLLSLGWEDVGRSGELRAVGEESRADTMGSIDFIWKGKGFPIIPKDIEYDVISD